MKKLVVLVSALALMVGVTMAQNPAPKSKEKPKTEKKMVAKTDTTKKKGATVVTPAQNKKAATPATPAQKKK